LTKAMPLVLAASWRVEGRCRRCQSPSMPAAGPAASQPNPLCEWPAPLPCSLLRLVAGCDFLARHAARLTPATMTASTTTPAAAMPPIAPELRLATGAASLSGTTGAAGAGAAAVSADACMATWARGTPSASANTHEVTLAPLVPLTIAVSSATMASGALSVAASSAETPKLRPATMPSALVFVPAIRRADT